MADFGDEALSRQQQDLADLMAGRRARAAASAPAGSTCTSCGAAIEPRRRQSLPATNLCAACATDHARGRR